VIEFLTSTGAMDQTTLPESMIVLGAGYVGLEQSQLWAQLGVHVTIVGRFAPHTEPELAELLKAVFTADGITVIEQRAVSVATPSAVSRSEPTPTRRSPRSACSPRRAAVPTPAGSAWKLSASKPTSAASSSSMTTSECLRAQDASRRSVPRVAADRDSTAAVGPRDPLRDEEHAHPDQHGEGERPPQHEPSTPVSSWVTFQTPSTSCTVALMWRWPPGTLFFKAPEVR